ncbi:MAG: glutathione S-transferase family protein [Oleiphilaceae bacterium]|nr:glutathione S-transferase family protein [Oleiphilaceae bacterium]
MKGLYQHYGWELSLFSGKTRAYLRFKQLPFRDRTIRLWQMESLKKRVGAQVMPVVATPEGEYLQDTSEIIGQLEARHPNPSVMPETPRQRMAACLLEAWGDEFWLPSAMHYRWNFQENFEKVFRPEAGDNLLPLAPRFLKNRLADRVAGTLRGFLPALGVVPEQTAKIESCTRSLCDALDRHFALHPYLLGGRPSLGDFGLIGPLYAHLGRDPYPARELIAPRPHLQAWVSRMMQPPEGEPGDFLPDDEIPDTLEPLLASVCREFRAFTEGTRSLAEKVAPTLSQGRGFPRQLEKLDIPFGESSLTLSARPFVLWKLQRIRDQYGALDESGREAVQQWLSQWQAGDWLSASMPWRLTRKGLYVLPSGRD